MTDEELLEMCIYRPDVIDDRIEAYFKLGFGILLKHKEGPRFVFRYNSTSNKLYSYFYKSLVPCKSDELFAIEQHGRDIVIDSDYVPLTTFYTENIKELLYENVIQN